MLNKEVNRTLRFCVLSRDLNIKSWVGWLLVEIWPYPNFTMAINYDITNLTSWCFVRGSNLTLIKLPDKRTPDLIVRQDEV